MNNESTELAQLTITEAVEVGEILARSGFFSDITKVSQAVAKILAGRELGFGPIASLTGIYIVKGRVTLSANLMAATIKRHPRYDYIVRCLNDQQCTIVYMQYDGDAAVEIGESTFGIQDAEKAGLLRGDNWQKYPRNMLFARAMSNGAKWFCPDVLGGPIYVADEFGLEVDDDGEVIEGAGRTINVETGEITDNDLQPIRGNHPTRARVIKREPVAGNGKSANGQKRDIYALMDAANASIKERFAEAGLSSANPIPPDYTYDTVANVVGAYRKVTDGSLAMPKGQAEWAPEEFAEMVDLLADYKLGKAEGDGFFGD